MFDDTPLVDEVDVEGEYRPRFAKLAKRLALLGLQDKAIATALGITTAKFNKWCKTYPEFNAALHAGRENADAQVANALFQKACGYSHKTEKIFFDSRRGEIVRAETVEQYAPDTAACIFWLQQRQKSIWKESNTALNKTAREMTDDELYNMLVAAGQDGIPSAIGESEVSSSIH